MSNQFRYYGIMVLWVFSHHMVTRTKVAWITLKNEFWFFGIMVLWYCGFVLVSGEYYKVS
jgi:hypothetical protein